MVRTASGVFLGAGLDTSSADVASAPTGSKVGLPGLSAPSGDLTDTFLPSFGWLRFLGEDPAYETLSVEEAAKLLYQLDPSVLLANVATDYDPEIPDMEMQIADTADGNASRALQFEMDCPVCLHVGYDYHQDDREWYDALPDDQKFDWPDGTTVTEFYDIAGININGSRFGRPPEWIIPSAFAPGTVRLLAEPARSFLEEGLATVNFDATIYPRLEGLDFSRWAQADFRAHLEQQPATRLEQWDIDDPSTFDMRQYLQDHGLEPGEVTTPATDPAVREYTIRNHQALKRLYETVTDRIANREFPTPEVGTTPNADPLWNAPVAGIYLHDAFDVVGFEDKVPTVPPASVRDSLYKVGVAAGRFDKLPMNHEAAIDPANAADLGFDLDIRYTTLMRLQLAEAFAMGGRLAVNLTVSAGGQEAWENPSLQPIRWLNTDGTIPDDLPPFIDFLQAHRQFLEDVEHAADVAVVYSLPTMLWNAYPQWEHMPTAFRDSFEGITTLLRENGVPYDVTIFGHPRLWEDPAQRERLADYDVVVLPRTEAITDAQLERLRTLLDDGVSVIVSGEPPKKSGMYEPRDDAASLLESHENAVIIEDDPGLRRNRDGQDSPRFTEALENAASRQVELSTDADIGVNVVAQSSPDRHLVHLINYSYEVTNDTLTTHRDVTVTVRGIDSASSAWWYSPAGPRELSISETADGYEVTVPKLDIWGFIAFGTTDAVSPQAGLDAARSAVAKAEDAVDRAKDEGRTWELYHARHQLSNAQAMLEFKAAGPAQRWAERAIEQARHSYGTPRIGIDIGHEQSTSEMGWDRFSAIRSQFDDYEYTRVNEFSVDLLSDIELLIVPPAFEWRDAEYGFTEEEVAAVEQFVTDGGSLLVLGSAGMDRGVNDLLRAFELPVSDRQIRGKHSKATTALSPLTMSVGRFEADLVAPLVEPPSAADIVGWMPEDTDAWYHEEEPRNERSSSEPSAAGAPVYAYRPWQGGLVAYLGSVDAYVKEDPEALSGESGALVKHSLDVLGKHGRLNLRQATTTETPTVSPTSQTPTPASATMYQGQDSGPSATDPDSSTTRREGDGFGIAMALAAMGGATFLLNRINGSDE